MVNGVNTDDEDDVFDKTAVATLSNCTNIFKKFEKTKRIRSPMKKVTVAGEKNFIQNCNHVDSSLNRRSVEKVMTSR